VSSFFSAGTVPLGGLSFLIIFGYRGGQPGEGMSALFLYRGPVYLKIVEPTPFGPVALVWAVVGGAPRIVRVFLTMPGRPAGRRAEAAYPDSRLSGAAEIDAVAAGIEAFLAGEAVVFPLSLVALDGRPAFQRAVLRVEHGIPRGRVSTYGLIARRLGRPTASRAVGQALARNPFPLIVPCHRAVRSDGGLGGFQGGPAMKRALLRREGIVFDGDGRVAVRRFHYS
jgi:methylated-DNA-[protein]-cysteine S-methyltransferase